MQKAKPSSPETSQVRIIGGSLRGRKIVFSEQDILTANEFSVRRERSRRGSVHVVHDRSRCSSQQNRKVISEEYKAGALRPTPDRIRETLFNWLSPVIIDAECFDAFGGSGALSFEAISRGAKHVTLIEKCPYTLKNIQQNAERFSIPASAFSFFCEDTLNYLENTAQTFDIIFLDPPFQSDLLAKCIECIAARNLLRPNGYIYLESSSPILSENMPSHWVLHRAKKAGSVYYALCKATCNKRDFALSFANS